MNLTCFLKPMAKFQCAGMPIHNDSNGWTQPISIIQSLFDTRMQLFQIFDHLPDRIPLHGNKPLSIRKITQQRWNPNNWQIIILFADSVPRRFARALQARRSCGHLPRDKLHSQARQAAGQLAPLLPLAHHRDVPGLELQR